MDASTRKPPFSKNLKLLIFALASFIIFLVVAFGLYLPYIKAYSLVHPERRPNKQNPADFGISDYENVEFTTPDGITLKGWYIAPKNNAVVVFVHGHRSNRAQFLDYLALVNAQGYGALLFDVRNHGESGGTITTLGLYEAVDAESGVSFVRSRLPKARIALYGHSMGAGASLLAAAETPEVSAVIVESPFTSLEDNIADGVRELTGLPPFPFAPLVVLFAEREVGNNLHTVRPIDVIGKISPRAVLLIHGEDDLVFPASNSRKLFDAAKEPKQLYIIPEVGHAGFLQAKPNQFPKTVLTFLDTYLKEP
jgi:dipeptidyl aminopeptidase/acylaminoacyl peptidase